jgi:hypothetical protein
MRHTQIGIGSISHLLLPAGLVSELSIASIRADVGQRQLTFRLESGEAFERRGFIGYDPAEGFSVQIAERYLPQHDLAPVCGCAGLPASRVAVTVLEEAGYAQVRETGRVHWWFSHPGQEPAYSTRPAAGLAALEAASYATLRETACFVHQGPGGYHYAANPPAFGTGFFSVTSHGEWSLHQREDTRPLDSAPDARAFAWLARDPARALTHLPEIARHRHASAAEVARADLIIQAASVPGLNPARSGRSTTATSRRRGR